MGTSAGVVVEPSGAACGAVVRGVDLRALTQEQAEEIRAVWLSHKVVSFPDQDLSLDEYEQVAQRFGPYGEERYLVGLDDHPHVAEIRREPDETAPVFAEGWHSDWSFLATPPTATFLYGRIIPPVGGDTLYADQQAAYEALPADVRARIDGLQGVHSARRGYAKSGAYGDKDVGRSMRIKASDDAFATQLHPLVLTHPETGRKGLYVSPAYTIGVDGLSDDESKELLGLLFAHQGREEFVYRHRWDVGTVAMWDNRSVVHMATGGYQGHRRLLHRITVAPR